MQLHQLPSPSTNKKEKRIGRGGKRGTYSGRGVKGQNARSGHRKRPAERDIIKKIPKLRGYRFKSFRPGPAVVNVRDLERSFKVGETVSPETLVKAGLVQRMNGKTPKVKVLGTGELKKKLIFKDVIFSKSAEQKTKAQYV